MKWEELNIVRAGDYGEELFDNYCISISAITYAPKNLSSHPLDRFMFYRNDLFMVDIKTKPKRLYYNDTGIDYNKYLQYKFKSEKYNMDFLLIFIDYIKAQMYGNFIKELNKKYIDEFSREYPLIDKDRKNLKIYFNIEQMKIIKKLSDYDVEKIKELSESKYY